MEIGGRFRLWAEFLCGQCGHGSSVVGMMLDFVDFVEDFAVRVRLAGRSGNLRRMWGSKIRRGFLRASIGLCTQRLCVSDELVGGIPV